MDDATSDLRRRYTSMGLHDAQRVQRVVRQITLPAGTRLFKLSRFPIDTSRPISPWWSSVEQREESAMGAKEMLLEARLNRVPLDVYVRMASAVSADWNRLDNYIEFTLAASVTGFWGQFAPQGGFSNRTADPKGEYYTRVGGEQTFLPHTLGGVGAWQFYLPRLTADQIAPHSIISIAVKTNTALSAHLGVGPNEGRQNWT